MEKISAVGVDLGQSSFHVYGVDSRGRKVLAKKLSRAKFAPFMAQLEPCRVGLEACRGSHHWARELSGFGHEVCQMHPKYVRPYVKTNKNDWADAEAIAEAMERPNMRFVPAKTLEQQSMQILHGARSSAIRARTAKANQLRAYLHELGEVVPRGLPHVRRRVPGLLDAAQGRWPALAIRVLHALYEELCALDEQVARYDREVRELASRDEKCRQLMTIPGVGPLSATALLAKVGRGDEFSSSRHLSAWLGLVPRHCGTGGKNQLYGISKRGDRYIRTLLIHGARSVLSRCAQRPDGRVHWALEVAERRGHNIACVALANKMARVAWAVLRSGTDYEPLALSR